MNKCSNATAISALTMGMAGSLFLAVNEIIFHRDGFAFLLSGLVGFFLYGIIGFLFAWLLSFPLKPIFKSSSHPLSFFIFLAIGIFVPLLILHGANQIHVHGVDPYSPEEFWATIWRMTAVCSIGAAGSVGAWYTLLREKKSYGN